MAIEPILIMVDKPEFHIVKMYKGKVVDKNVKNIFYQCVT